MAIIDTLTVFPVSLLAGATGVYIGSRVMTNTDSFPKAVVTATVGPIVWTIIVHSAKG